MCCYSIYVLKALEVDTLFSASGGWTREEKRAHGELVGKVMCQVSCEIEAGRLVERKWEGPFIADTADALYCMVAWAHRSGDTCAVVIVGFQPNGRDFDPDGTGRDKLAFDAKRQVATFNLLCLGGTRSVYQTGGVPAPVEIGGSGKGGTGDLNVGRLDPALPGLLRSGTGADALARQVTAAIAARYPSTVDAASSLAAVPAHQDGSDLQLVMSEFVSIVATMDVPASSLSDRKALLSGPASLAPARPAAGTSGAHAAPLAPATIDAAHASRGRNGTERRGFSAAIVRAFRSVFGPRTPAIEGTRNPVAGNGQREPARIGQPATLPAPSAAARAGSAPHDLTLESYIVRYSIDDAELMALLGVDRAGLQALAAAASKASWAAHPAVTGSATSSTRIGDAAFGAPKPPVAGTTTSSATRVTERCD